MNVTAIRIELSRRIQRTEESVAEYARSLKLFGVDINLSRDELLGYFQSGLSPTIRTQLDSYQFNNFDETFSKAFIVESNQKARADDSAVSLVGTSARTAGSSSSTGLFHVIQDNAIKRQIEANMKAAATLLSLQGHGAQQFQGAQNFGRFQSY